MSEVGDGVGEVVAVGVEEGKVGELVREAGNGRGADRPAVEVNTGDGAVPGVRQGGAGEALVLADVWAGPGSGYPRRVAGDRALKPLDY